MFARVFGPEFNERQVQNIAPDDIELARDSEIISTLPWQMWLEA